MDRLGFTFSSLAVAAAVSLLVAGHPQPARAQATVADHLKCYKIKDSLALKGIVDLATPQFGLEQGCKISKATDFCVPAVKTVREAVDQSTGAPITLLPISGPPAAGDYICYTIRCPKPFPDDQSVSDQFGNRTLSKFTASRLCVPAVKGPPVPKTCGESFPQCNGTCPNPGDICVGLAGSTGCECLPPLPCGQTFPQCNGSCPAATPNCVPVTTAATGAICRCK